MLRSFLGFLQGSISSLTLIGQGCGRMARMKNFDGWNKRKKKIQHRDTGKVYFHEGEIWWAALGVNVGHEQDGGHSSKDHSYIRPVLILRKFNRGMAFCLPITSRSKASLFHFQVVHNGEENSIILSQGRLLSPKRLVRKIRRLPQGQLDQVRVSFLNLFRKNDSHR